MAENTFEGVNIAMRGGGYYSAATKGARDVIDNATPIVLDTIGRLPDHDYSSAFTMTDMGCADGGTSLEPRIIQGFSGIQVLAVGCAR